MQLVTTNRPNIFSSYEEEHSQERLKELLLVFRADLCAEARVYYLEEKKSFGRMRYTLRQAMSNKQNKAVLTQNTPITIGAAKLIIASQVAKAIMTGVRWELYTDKNQTTLLEQGRYDHLDLMKGISKEQWQQYREEGIPIPTEAEDWDFDGLLRLHTCPRCSQPIKAETLIFDPYFLSCSYCEKSEQSSYMEMRWPLEFISRFVEDLQRGKENTIRRDILQPTYFLDIHAGPIVCWMIEYYAYFQLPASLVGRPESFKRADGKEYPYTSLIQELLDMSLFRMLNSDYLAKQYRTFMIGRLEEEEAREKVNEPTSFLESIGVVELDEWIEFVTSFHSDWNKIPESREQCFLEKKQQDLIKGFSNMMSDTMEYIAKKRKEFEQ